ncbi:MAG: hypothetical protein Q7T29_08355 [Gallionella sp.]|nr:hypothetical protein [Gallionella sp.]
MITGILRSSFISLGIACTLQFFFAQIQSGFVFDLLKSNITNLQVALLAVNAATLGIVLTKIREIIDKTGAREAFESTRQEMMLSIKEQITLIGASLLIISLATAKTPPVHFPDELYQALLLTSFVYSLLILYDTAKSVFVLLDYEL